MIQPSAPKESKEREEKKEVDKAAKKKKDELKPSNAPLVCCAMDARLRSSSQSPEVATAERTRVFTPPFQSLVFVFFHSLFSRFQLLLLCDLPGR